MSEGRTAHFWIGAGFLPVCICAIGVFAAPFLWDVFRPPPQIRFVLPPGFRGGFIIVEDDAGVDLGGRFASLYILVVPTSRVAKVKSFAPFDVMHTASTQMGENGPISKVNLDPPDDAIELRGGGSGSQHVNGVQYRERIHYCFGTAAEAANFDHYSIPADLSERVIP